MLSTTEVQAISSDLAQLLRNPGATDEKNIVALLSCITNKRDFLGVHNVFGLMRASKHTPFRDLTQWLKRELPENQFKKTVVKFYS